MKFLEFDPRFSRHVRCGRHQALTGKVDLCLQIPGTPLDAEFQPSNDILLFCAVYRQERNDGYREADRNDEDRGKRDSHECAEFAQ